MYFHFLDFRLFFFLTSSSFFLFLTSPNWFIIFSAVSTSCSGGTLNPSICGLTNCITNFSCWMLLEFKLRRTVTGSKACRTISPLFWVWSWKHKNIQEVVFECSYNFSHLHCIRKSPMIDLFVLDTRCIRAHI